MTNSVPSAPTEVLLTGPGGGELGTGVGVGVGLGVGVGAGVAPGVGPGVGEYVGAGLGVGVGARRRSGSREPLNGDCPQELTSSATTRAAQRRMRHLDSLSYRFAMSN